jgi:CO dehydrogenase maturation factor
VSTLAFLGKGGVGKTVLSCLAARLLARAGRRVLLVDADPARGLSAAVGLDPADGRTLGEARDRLVGAARAPDGSAAGLAQAADYLLLEALGEVRGFGFLAMGPGREPGCFCAVNRLLRDALEALAAGFDDVVIDGEAGLEQVSREVFRRVDLPVVVTDASARGAQAALAIAAAAARRGQPRPAGVVANRGTPAPALRARLDAANLVDLGAIPLDEEVARADREGGSLLDLPAGTPARAGRGAIRARRGRRAAKAAAHRKRSRSTFPPDRMMPTRSSRRSTARSSATATGTADEGSMTIFMRSSTWRMARTMAGSSTVTMRSTWVRMAAKVSSPSDVRSPSHTVVGLTDGTMRPSASERQASSAPAGSVPMTRTPGPKPRPAMAVPDSSPPPPTGVMMTSSRGTSSSSSSAAVPWPAMTRASLYGCTTAAPVSRTTSASVDSRAASVGSQVTMRAP